MENALPPIPAKRYFTIGEVGELCDVKPHVLRYWEQEFTQLRPMKRRGNRRYYQHHEVLMIRRIRALLYEQGFTISGARNKLQELAQFERHKNTSPAALHITSIHHGPASSDLASQESIPGSSQGHVALEKLWLLRHELFEIRELLSAAPS
jgi:DNA-binding transcriptional MerR regulator